MSTNCYMFTNHRNNTSCVNLYLLQMELGIEEGLADAEQLSQTPKQPSTSTTSNHARPAARASRSQNQDTDSGKYFVWDNNKVFSDCLSSNGDAGDAMEEDNISFPSGYSIPGLEALAEAAPHDPIVPRVLSSSSAFSFPSTSANPFGSPGAAPRNHLASTAFGVDQEPKKESTGLSSPTKKTSASKKQDDIADLVQACTAESLQACIKMACSARTGPQSNSNVDTMLANMPGSSSNDSASHCQHNISNDEVSNSVF
ncbi:uncharacterized protein UBRO2_02293 [Ustilago bromivora]|uniref:Uncharacterized protein n=1 Tax=Ustilago bromivora TaxID=307758 RepID=A0A8H8TQC5_9BASI|nr:uncharacterized protein UBRO2_02293 [Ustilago bromivora]